MPKPSKRDQLVGATKELLWEVGYEAMSPRDIQLRSAARPGSLYHHFPLQTCTCWGGAWRGTEEEITRLEEIFALEQPPLEAVRRYLLLKRDAFRGCRLGRLVHEASIEEAELREPIAAYLDAVRRHLARCLNAAQRNHALRDGLDPDRLAITLTAIVQGGYVLARAHQDETMMQRAAEGALALLTGCSL